MSRLLCPAFPIVLVAAIGRHPRASMTLHSRASGRIPYNTSLSQLCIAADGEVVTFLWFIRLAHGATAITEGDIVRMLLMFRLCNGGSV